MSGINDQGGERVASGMPASTTPARKYKRVEPTTLVATAAATVTSMVAGSLFGDSGTLIGAAVGSVVSGTAAVAYENTVMAAKHHLHFKAGLTRAEMRRRAQLHRRKLAAGAVIMTAILFAGSVALLAVAEAATGKPLHATLTGSHQKWTSWNPQPASPAPVTPFPSQSPAQAPSQSPGATVSPTETGSPTDTSSPSVSPSASPSALPPTVLDPAPSGSPANMAPTPFPTGSP